jgi:hypothetical protein
VLPRWFDELRPLSRTSIPWHGIRFLAPWLKFIQAATNQWFVERIKGKQQGRDSLPLQYAEFAYAPPGFQKITPSRSYFDVTGKIRLITRVEVCAHLRVCAVSRGHCANSRKRNVAAFIYKFCN